MSLQHSPIKSIKESKSLKTPDNNFGSDPQLYGSAHSLHTSGDGDFASRRLKRKHNEETLDSDSIVNQMKEMFSTFETQQNFKLEKIIESTLTIKNQNNEIQQSIDFLSSRYDEIFDKMRILEEKNKSNEEKIELLENKIEQLERKARTSSVEIRNIPIQPLENKSTLNVVLKKLCEVIELPLSTSDVHDIYRLKTKTEANNHIVVNFTTITYKNGFVKQCKTYNKVHKDNKLNTIHLGIPGSAKPIYIDESLTSLGRRLAFLARQYVKDNHYHSTWTSYGKVFLRKTQNSPVLRIECESDLTKLIQK